MRLRETEVSDLISAKLLEVFQGPLVSIVYLAVFVVTSSWGYVFKLSKRIS